MPFSDRTDEAGWCAGVYEPSLKHVLVSAHVRPWQPAGPVQMRTRALEQFPALSEEAFATVAADAASIGNSVAVTHLVGCRSRFRLPIDMGASVVPDRNGVDPSALLARRPPLTFVKARERWNYSSSAAVIGP